MFQSKQNIYIFTLNFYEKLQGKKKMMTMLWL